MLIWPENFVKVEDARLIFIYWNINKHYTVQEPFFKKVSTIYNSEKLINTYLK